MGLETVSGATPYGGPIMFDGGSKGYSNGPCYSTGSPADVGLHSLAGIDRVNLMQSVFHTNLVTALKFEGLETRQRLSEENQNRRQEETLRMVLDLKSSMIAEVSALKTDAYARELAAANQKLLVLELGKK